MNQICSIRTGFCEFYAGQNILNIKNVTKHKLEIFENVQYSMWSTMRVNNILCL